MMDERSIDMNGVYTNLTFLRALLSMIVRDVCQSIKKGAEAPVAYPNAASKMVGNCSSKIDLTSSAIIRCSNCVSTPALI